MAKTYYCDCQKWCKGRRRQVSRATHSRHKPYRDPYAHYSAATREFLNRYPIIHGPEASSNASRRSQAGSSSSGAIVPSTTATSNSVPRVKKRRGQAGDGHRESISVCAFSIDVPSKADLRFQNSDPGPPSATGFAPDEVLPSGPPDASPRNRDNIETA